MDTTGSRYAIGTLMFLLSGPIAWAAHFAVLYGLQSPMCALDIGETPDGGNPTVTALIVLATLLLIGLPVLLAWRPQPVHRLLAGAPLSDEHVGFLIPVMRALVALSSLAMAYAGLAALLLPACAALR